MRMAAEMEASTEKNPVTPGPVLPALELYGDMLLETRDFSAAREAYEAALSQSPGRMMSLYGAGRAAELAGDIPAATDFYRQLVENSPSPNVNLPQLAHARQFLEAGA